MKTKHKHFKYPQIHDLGLTIIEEPVSHIRFEQLAEVLDERKQLAQFWDLFGIQTCYEFGPYPWDVEAVLERMASGKKTGSQLIWD